MAKKRPRSRPQAPPDPGPLDAALLVTYGGEAALGIVEYSHPPATQAIQGFTQRVQEVSARPSDPALNSYRARDIARYYFQKNDKHEPYLRVVGRVLDELLNHRGKNTCSAGDVYLVLLEETPLNLPAAHRQSRPFNKTLNPGRKVIFNRLTELQSQSLPVGEEPIEPLVVTDSTTQGGARTGNKLTVVGRWLFDGWPELPELLRGRS